MNWAPDSTVIYVRLCWELNGSFPKDTLVAQSCRLCAASWTVWSPPGSSVHGIFQARILEWVAISFSRGTSRPRDQTWLSCSAGTLFTIWLTKEAPKKIWLKKEEQVIKRWPELAPSFPLNCLVNTRWTKQLLKQGLHSGGDDLTTHLRMNRAHVPSSLWNHSWLSRIFGRGFGGTLSRSA